MSSSKIRHPKRVSAPENPRHVDAKTGENQTPASTMPDSMGAPRDYEDREETTREAEKRLGWCRET